MCERQTPIITRRKDTSGLKVDPTARGRERGDPRERALLCAPCGSYRPCLSALPPFIAVVPRGQSARGDADFTLSQGTPRCSAKPVLMCVKESCTLASFFAAQLRLSTL